MNSNIFAFHPKLMCTLQAVLVKYRTVQLSFGSKSGKMVVST